MAKMTESAFASVFLIALAGLALSVIIERQMMPRLPLKRPRAAWALHGGLWISAHAVLTLVLSRPWFAAAAVSAFLLMLVLVSNAKFKALHEPFVFQDYEYFTDAIRYPRLYIPFLGWWKFLSAATGVVLAVSIGLWGETVPTDQPTWAGQLSGSAVLFVVGILLVKAGNCPRLPLSFEPVADLRAMGLLACLWRYAQEEAAQLAIASPFDFLPTACSRGDLPHLVAVQSESFFDPRSLYSGIRPDVLKEFDRLRVDAVAHGKLKVPAWGANTVRTEFSFLSGISGEKLGVHRFNPYRAIVGGWEVSSLAIYLKRLGYHTICIHPYPSSFYQRNRVYPRLGFDEFLDIRAFKDSMRFGPYISDAAVAERVSEHLREATGPVFIFVITMENHGPLHLERVAPSDIDTLYVESPPAGCDDLTIYLRHLRNADQMIGKLRQILGQCERPTSLCWFGDHVPIMPTVYETFGKPNGAVEYIYWSSQNLAPSRSDYLDANELSVSWLRDVVMCSTNKGAPPALPGGVTSPEFYG